MKQHIIFSLLVAGTLTACGGSDSKTTPVLTDTGVFQNSHQTGLFYTPQISNSSLDYNFGLNSGLCQTSYREHYYETDNALIFGNPNLANEDYFVAAGWVESALEVALSAMNMTKAEYFAVRTDVSLTARQKLRQALSNLYQAGDSYGSFTYPDSFDESTDIETILAWQTRTVQLASFDDIAQALIADPYSGYTAENEIRLEQKIYVCINDNASDFGWGEGHLAGINIGAYSKGVPYAVDQLIVHELVHSMQYALTANVDGLRLPRWFSEGQAVFLSGQNRAKKSQHAEYDPTAVVDFYDEVGDPGIAYRHYGLAYQYLQDANGLENIKTMLQRVKNDDYIQHDYSILGNENANYRQAFNGLMLDINQQTLTVEQYRINYHSYLNDYASKP